MNQYQAANTNSSHTQPISARHHTHTTACTAIVYCMYEHMLHATCTTKYLHVDTGSQINTLSRTLGFLVGTPVSLRASIVVHLAVLCATLWSQHACHLKPDTYGSASSWSDAPLLLWSQCWCWRHSTWHILCVKSLLCCIYLMARLRLRTLFFTSFELFHELFALNSVDSIDR